MTYDLFIAALCIWREARGESYRGKQLVWSVLCERLRSGRWGSTFYDVVTWPKQFSSFNGDDPNSRKLPHPEDDSWIDCLNVVNEPPDLVGTHLYYYFNPFAVQPSWDFSQLIRLTSEGHHEFWAENQETQVVRT